MAWALLKAGGTARALVEINGVACAFTELDNRVFWTCTVAAVALKAVAAGEAARGFEDHFCFRESTDDFAKAILSTRQI